MHRCSSRGCSRADNQRRHHCSHAVCELDETLHAAGIEFCFAEMKDAIMDKLKHFGLFKRFGEQTFFVTLGEAVSAYLAIHPVEWVYREIARRSSRWRIYTSRVVRLFA